MIMLIKDTNRDVVYNVTNHGGKISNERRGCIQTKYLGEAHESSNGFIFYDALFYFITTTGLTKLFLSMIPGMYYRRTNDMGRFEPAHNDPNLIADITSKIKDHEHEICLKILMNMSRDILNKWLYAAETYNIDICEFYLDMYVTIQHCTDRKFFMSLFGYDYNGTERIMRIKSSYLNTPLGLLNVDNMIKYDIHFDHLRDNKNGVEAIVKSHSTNEFYNYRITYNHIELRSLVFESANEHKVNKEKNPMSYVITRRIVINDDNGNFKYVDALYNIAISNKNLCVKYIKENKDTILKSILETIDIALKRRHSEITSNMLKFDNIVVTNDCRLVCKLSLKSELAAKVVELGNEDKAILLFKQGLNRKKIAEKLGLNYQTICRYTRGM